MIEITIDPFDTCHLARHDELFGIAFSPGEPLRNKAYVSWLYRENPFGLARMVKAVEAGRWVGFMAMIPLLLVRRDVQVPGYCVVNVVVHPSYRGQNIFGRMIASAIQLTSSEHAVLVGYPNNMALKSWQRAGMHFQTPLKLFLAVPTLPVKVVHIREIVDIDTLKPSLVLLREQALQGERWSPFLSADYVRWRYLQHPVHTYRVQQVEVGGAPAGFVVSRRARARFNVLVGEFAIDRFAAQALRNLPLLTVALKPEMSTRELHRALWPLPLKKRIPFFCTHYQQRFEGRDTEALGLSMSDF
jgi:GNAT superfamily N-acetyltransferase